MAISETISVVYNLPWYPESVQYGLHLTKGNLWDYWGAVFLKNGCYSCSPTDSVKVLNSKNRIGECYVFVIWSKISQSDFCLENRTYLK